MSAKSTYDIAIIGGGIVGMATAMALVSNHQQKLIVLEAEDRFATHQSGKNSGVIHSGLYYKPASLKARNCVTGRETLYKFCTEHDIPHNKCGKIVVARTKSEIPTLERLERNGRTNGLKNLERITPEEIREREPHVTGVAGLWVPETGIVDFERVTNAFADVVQQAGGEVRTCSEAVGVKRDSEGLMIETTNGEIDSKNLINCAGLYSDRVAHICGVEPGVRIVPFRGEYYELDSSKHHLVNHIVYHVPNLEFPFLGVHFVKKIKGKIAVGPNAVLAFKREGYTKLSFSPRDVAETLTYPGVLRLFTKHWRMGVSEFHRSFSKHAFVETLQKFLPEVGMDDLRETEAGVRAQAIDQNGVLVDDFHIVEAKRMIHVLNAPSPAATASICIGKHIAQMAERSFEMS